MAASQSGVFNVQQFTDLGGPLIGGRLYTYAYGTTTQKTAFTDAAGSIPHTYTSDGQGGQYIALNARGELPASLCLGLGSYDLALKRADGSTVWTRRADGVASAGDLAGPAGAGLIGWLRAAVGGVLTTFLKWMGWQPYSVFDFLTEAQIADVVANTTLIDLTVPFQKAIDAAAVKSGILNAPAGTYLLGTVRQTVGPSGYSEQILLEMRSNVTIVGACRATTILKVADGLVNVYPNTRGAIVFADGHQTINNFTLRDIKIDFNGANNLLTAGNQQIMPGVCVWDAYAADNITIDNVWFHQCSGLNAIFLGLKTKNSTVKNCRFTDMTDSIPGNVITDHSTIYIDGINNRVLNNTFKIRDDFQSLISTGIEGHGTNLLVQGNVLDGYGAPFLFAATDPNVANTGNIYQCNVATRAVIGFAYDCRSFYLNVSFANNSVKLRKQKVPYGTGLRYTHSAVDSSNFINFSTPDYARVEVYVRGNTFEQEVPDVDWVLADRQINNCLHIQSTSLLEVVGNTFIGFQGSAATFLKQWAAINPSYSIRENRFEGCGWSREDAGYNGAYRFYVDRQGVGGRALVLESYNNVFSNCKYRSVLYAEAAGISATKVRIEGDKHSVFITPFTGVAPTLPADHRFIYSTDGNVDSTKVLAGDTHISGEITCHRGKPGYEDTDILKYVKVRLYRWMMRLTSSTAPVTGSNSNPMWDVGGDRVEMLAPGPSGPSFYVCTDETSHVWKAGGRLDA